MKVSIPETFKQTLKDMPTKVKGPIKKKKKTSVDILLESENKQGRPAQKSHHRRKAGEEKCIVHRTERKEKGNSRNLSS